MPSLRGKTIFITGASRGIGKAIALRAARDGANIVIAAKTTEPHPKLAGTIFTAAQEIEAGRRPGTGAGRSTFARGAGRGRRRASGAAFWRHRHAWSTTPAPSR